MDIREVCYTKCTNKLSQNGEIHLSVPTDNGITDHKFLYGTQIEEAKEAADAAKAAKLKDNN